MAVSPAIVRFGEFTLDPSRRLLLRADAPLHLSPKAFDLLALLVDRRPDPLSKQEIFGQLWTDTFVTDNVLATMINDIRRALGATARKPCFIRTVHRYGYSFVGDGLQEIKRSLRRGN